ncbi:hypothetical protein BCY86_00200 [Pajaroellobacter abortibovis]|uniref:Uncharacterized protein n=1 Tax=Pajaroellobacter abortibovis TaxID=1882918 RepID=A0A1L6MUY4_9BACT|nr:hypothetical protein BCY86_00200 [Pajaroellobacter abortibovis]
MGRVTLWRTYAVWPYEHLMKELSSKIPLVAGTDTHIHFDVARNSNFQRKIFSKAKLWLSQIVLRKFLRIRYPV